MNFSERYIEICLKLHELRPRKAEEWEEGDWYACEIRGKTVVTMISRSAFIENTRVDWDAYWERDGYWWLPSRESDWFDQPEWVLRDRFQRIPDVDLNNHDYTKEEYDSAPLVYRIIREGFRGGSEVLRDPDPLVACAEAWLKNLTYEIESGKEHGAAARHWLDRADVGEEE